MRILQSRATLIILSAIMTGTTLSAQSHSKIPDEIQATVRARVEAGDNRSIIIGIVDAGGTRYFSHGSISAAHAASPDEHTLFEIGSATKVFTALLLADMAARGEVKLDDPITMYLPDSLANIHARSVTLRGLASHTSGLPRVPDNLDPADPANPYADYTVADLYADLAADTVGGTPGAGYDYSNLGMGLLGHLLARRAGTDYESLVTRRILAPLGMTETRITLDDASRKLLAPGHSDGEQVSNWDIPTLAGAGALRSTAHDMLAFMAANLGLGRTPLLEPMRATHVAQAPAGEGMRIALGWHIQGETAGRQIIWHNGGTGGYCSFIGFDRDAGRGVVVLTNSSVEVDDIGFHLLDTSWPLRTVHKAIELPAATLDRYVGEYRLAPEFTIAVTRDGAQLLITPTAQPTTPIYPQSATEFFLRAIDAQITFNLNATGDAESLTLHQGGHDMVGKRIR